MKIVGANPRNLLLSSEIFNLLRELKNWRGRIETNTHLEDAPIELELSTGSG